MRVGPVTKTDKRNRARSKRSDDDIMSVNCDVIFLSYLWSIFNHPEAGFPLRGQ